MIELLEPRIAPATILLYTDVDGDEVKLSLSSGDLAVTPLSGVLGAATVTISNADGASLNMTVTKAPGGDGLANIGFLDANGQDLGTVTLKGDLGRIIAGDADPTDASVKSLNVRSLGRFGLATQGAGGSLISTIEGDLGALVVRGDVTNVNFRVGDDIGAITIGGSLVGGVGDLRGFLLAFGDIGTVKIARDIVGGPGGNSGLIQSFSKIGSVTVGGSVIGGSQQYAGSIVAATEITSVKIGHDLRGGSALYSGSVIVQSTAGKLLNASVKGSLIGSSGERSGGIYAGEGVFPAETALIAKVTIGGSMMGGGGKGSGSLLSDALGSLTLGGSLIGGQGSSTGVIDAPLSAEKIAIKGSVLGEAGGSLSGAIRVGPIKSISVGGDIIGASVSGGESASATGYIDVSGLLGKLNIGGSLIAGRDSSTSFNNQSGAVRASFIGAMTVKGSIVGNLTNPVSITASGVFFPVGTYGPSAIASLTVGGDVSYAVIETGNGPLAANATIGPVKVGGDWRASTIKSGVNFNNTAVHANNISLIASITIGGAIIGSETAGDSFFFVADEIGSFKSLSLISANVAGLQTFSAETGGDVKLSEL
jgi:hypothetical protein